ncbi:hypothetical protein OG21DRAFT_1481014 [Imleria badia]|nr:hypothetical protein OG21DRAFT_1481014 [Imleria badia]
MVYGRVIGNELRDVPPECLPIWGQRWSSYRAPHGPSPFSTRIFSVDRMSEVGPALTSPTQFEVTLAEEDEGEDATSESSQFRSSIPSSPLAIQADATGLASRPETPMPRSDRRSSNYPHDSPKMLHWSTGHPPPQTSTRFCTTLLPRRQFVQSGTQYRASEPILQPPALHHGIPIQSGHRSFENDCALWGMDCTPTSIQPPADHSHPIQIPTGQLQHTILPHSIPEWHFANAHTQSSEYPLQLDPSSYPGSGCLLLPFQADEPTRIVPTMSPSSSHCFTIPFPQQNVAPDSSRNHESSINMIPGIAHPQYPVMPPWRQGSTLPNSPFPRPLQDPGSPPGLGVFYHLVSDHHEQSTHSEGFLGTFAQAEGFTSSKALGPPVKPVPEGLNPSVDVPASFLLFVKAYSLAMSSQTHSSESQRSANPDTPPPEYSVHVPNQQSPPSSQHSLVNAIPGHYPYREQSLFSSSIGPQFAPPPSFGPTPLMQSQPTLGLLPYYDPHSPYSIEAATSRARWRFIGAAFWAIGLIVCLLLLGALRGLQAV